MFTAAPRTLSPTPAICPMLADLLHALRLIVTADHDQRKRGIAEILIDRLPTLTS